MTTPATRFVSKTNLKDFAKEAKKKYTNQDAFGKVKVGEAEISADAAVDTIEFVAGSNVTLTPDTTNGKVTVAATDTTYSDVTADSTGAAASGLMTSSDKAKLDGIAAGAEVNQNAFGTVTVGATSVVADSKTDTLTITAGTNMTITGDASTDGITFSAADTTYSLGQDGTDGHKITLTPSTGQATTITIPDNDTTYSAAVASTSGVGGTDGLITAADQEKLEGIAAGAEVNTIEGVQVNGSDLAVGTGDKVNITVTTGDSGVGTIKVNGSSVTVYGLGDAAAAGLASNGVADGETGLVTGDEVADAIDAAISSTYKPAGSLAPSGVVSSLLVAANEGKVYNLSGALTLDATSAALFVDGTSGESFPEGTNIVVVDAGSGSYKFDVLAGFVDLAPYQVAADLGELTSAEMDEIYAEL